MAPLRAGDPLPPELTAATVLDEEGEPYALRELIAGRPCLLIFLRHFGCIGCSENVHDLGPRLAELEHMGLQTLFIGNGAPRFIEDFVARNGIADRSARFFTDPTLRAFRATGLHRGVLRTLGPRAVADAVGALGRGHRQGRLLGDPWQQGGTLLVDRAGVVRYLHRNRRLGDHAGAVDIADAALKLLVQASAVTARV
jgi:peroxiredoxin